MRVCALLPQTPERLGCGLSNLAELLPYPRSLPWPPPTSLWAAWCQQALRSFPQFDSVAEGGQVGRQSTCSSVYPYATLRWSSMFIGSLAAFQRCWALEQWHMVYHHP